MREPRFPGPEREEDRKRPLAGGDLLHADAAHAAAHLDTGGTEARAGGGEDPLGPHRVSVAGIPEDEAHLRQCLQRAPQRVRTDAEGMPQGDELRAAEQVELRQDRHRPAVVAEVREAGPAVPLRSIGIFHR